MSRNMKWILLGAGVFAVGVGIAIGSQWRSGKAREAKAPTDANPLIELASAKELAVRFTSANAADSLGIEVTEAQPAPPPEPLRLPGSLSLDPSRLVHVHARFGGEAVSIGHFTEESGATRPLQYGDRVTKGQVLAIVWSKEIGEKKSEMVDALSKLDISKALLSRLESLQRGVVAERSILEARREVEAGLIAVEKAERTLRSWRLTEDEIDAVRQEYKEIQQRHASGQTQVQPEKERTWAEVEVRAAMDGIVVEKNFNVGDIVEQTDDLFKIADLSRLRVVAHIYEEDLWAIREVPDGQRKWSLDLKSDPGDNAIAGEFELIGNVIDPASRTGVIMGWIDNSEGNLAVGQFILATIQLPSSRDEVAIPSRAVIEEGDRSMVFVQTKHGPNEFARRKVSILRRSADTVFVKVQPSSKERAAGIEGIQVGEKVVVSSVLGLGGELEKLLSQAESQHASVSR